MSADRRRAGGGTQVLRINATGAYNCLYFGRPLMRPHKEGLVIKIPSIAGLRAGHLGGEAYSAEMKVVMLRSQAIRPEFS